MSLAPPTTVALDLRGVRLSLERDALMELPESVLLCLFPNGVVLSPQRQPGSPDENEEDVYFVDVSRCLNRARGGCRRCAPPPPTSACPVERYEKRACLP